MMRWAGTLPSWVTGAAVGAVIAAGVLLWFWRPWQPRLPVGRVILTEPVDRYDPDFVYQLPAPPATDWQRTGRVVDCPVIEPDSRSARRELALFGDEPLGDLLYIDPDVGELPYGGSLRVRRPEAALDAKTPPLVEVDLVAARAPLARWDSLHAWTLEGAAGTGQDAAGLQRRVTLGYRPGEAHVRRRWSIAPGGELEYRPDGPAGWTVWATASATYCAGTDCR